MKKKKQQCYKVHYKCIPLLKPKWKEIIRPILQKYPYIWFVYGSRAKGNCEEYSDLDLCIHSKFKSLEEKNKIIKEILESELPINVDIIAWNEISEKFRNEIRDSLIVLFY